MDKIILRTIQWPNDLSEKRACLWDISKQYNFPITTVKNRWRNMVTGGFIVDLIVKPNVEILGFNRAVICINEKAPLPKETVQFLKRIEYINYLYFFEDENIMVDFIYPKGNDPIEFINQITESRLDILAQSLTLIDNKLECSVSKKDLVILDLLMSQPLLNVKEISTQTGINRSVVSKSIEKLSAGNAFTVEPIINIKAVENGTFAIYMAEVPNSQVKTITRDVCLLLNHNFLMTKYFVLSRVIILTCFQNQQEIDDFKVRMSLLNVKKQMLTVSFRTIPTGTRIYKKLLENLVSRLNTPQIIDSNALVSEPIRDSSIDDI